jgi:hypothetical protein
MELAGGRGRRSLDRTEHYFTSASTASTLAAALTDEPPVTPLSLLLSEIDLIAAYVMPEDSWFIFPLTHILGATAVTLSPKRRRKPHINNPYREAWHLLRQPDGLEFA